MICTKCFTRMDACADCHEAELSAKDKEIEGLRAEIERIKREIREACKGLTEDIDMLEGKE
jgi:hypothetical protein